MRTAVVTAQTAVQAKLNDVETSRRAVEIQKEALTVMLTGFLGVFDGYYQGTAFYAGRPMVPGIGDGQDRFTAPMIDAMTLWEDINAGGPPAGVTLPVTLASGVDQGAFASTISGLQFAYRAVAKAEQRLKTGRLERTMAQDAAYDVMKAYRTAAPQKLSQHPALAGTIPKLTPDPGHTPDPVAASATQPTPGTTHVVHAASTDADISHYDLEGVTGPDWNDDDAVNLGRHNPDQPNEFTVTFGLTQPGTSIALKVFTVLNTGRRAGSAVMVVQRV